MVLSFLSERLYASFLFLSLIGYSGCDGIVPFYPVVPLVGELDEVQLP